MASVLASAAFQARARARARLARAGCNMPGGVGTRCMAVSPAAIDLVAVRAGASIGVSNSVLIFGVAVALASRTIADWYAQNTGSTVAFLMTRFVCGMVMPKMVTSPFVRLSVHAAVGADVD